MEYTGLITKYKNNRPLNDFEKACQLKQKEIQAGKPHDNFTLTAMNSTFLEVVDKYYGWKGFAFVFAVGVFCFIVIFNGAMLAGNFNDWAEIVAVHKEAAAIAASAFLGLLSLLLIGYCLWVITREAFTYTHWPVRFNRKNRKVYVFRHNGPNGVLELNWDDVFFTLGKCSSSLGVDTRDIRGLIVDKDAMVRNTFACGVWGSDQDALKRVWEYYRRYMEEGPQALPAPIGILPIAGRKESMVFGVKRMFANFAGAGVILTIIMSPFLALGCLGRTICMLTNRVPQWPQAVLDACKTKVDDPYEYHCALDGTAVRGPLSTPAPTAG